MRKLKFRMMQQGAEIGIKIYYGQGCEFWSCKRGSDLADFDALLAYFITDIDWEQLTPGIARWWEQELYRLLIEEKHHSKTFTGFCRRIEKRYRKRDIRGVERLKQNLIAQLENIINESMRFTKKIFRDLRTKSWQAPLPKAGQQNFL